MEDSLLTVTFLPREGGETCTPDRMRQNTRIASVMSASSRTIAPGAVPSDLISKNAGVHRALRTSCATEMATVARTSFAPSRPDREEHDAHEHPEGGPDRGEEPVGRVKTGRRKP